MKGSGNHQKTMMEDSQRLILEAMVDLLVKGKLPTFNKIRAQVWKMQREEAKRKDSNARPRFMSAITVARNIGPQATLTGGPWNPRHINLPRMRSLNARYPVVESTSGEIPRTVFSLDGRCETDWRNRHGFNEVERAHILRLIREGHLLKTIAFSLRFVGSQKIFPLLARRTTCYFTPAHARKAWFKLLHPNFVRAEKAIWNRAKERVKEQELCKGSRTAMDYYFEERKLAHLWLKKNVEKDSKFSQVKCYRPGFRMVEPGGIVATI